MGSADNYGVSLGAVLQRRWLAQRDINADTPLVRKLDQSSLDAPPQGTRSYVTVSVDSGE